MKIQPLSSGLRVTLSRSELEILTTLAQAGVDQLQQNRIYLTDRQVDMAAEIVGQLKSGQAGLLFKQAEAKERRDRPKREAARRAAHEHHAAIDGYNVSGMLGDWADISDDPDRNQWADMFHPDFRPRDQMEVRRHVWLIRVTRGSALNDDFVILPSACTETDDRAQITPLVRQMIAAGRPDSG